MIRYFARRVVYSSPAEDEQVRWGNCEDPRPVLTLGQAYDVERADIHTWHTKLFLKGIDSGRGFNSVNFTEAEQ
jgi:hypothetical protein